MNGTAQIAEMVARLNELASPGWFARLSQHLAERSLQLIDDGFAARRDPYGEPWAPTKQPNPILERTGHMRSDFREQYVGADGFAVGDGTDYSQYHQRGTATIERRMVVPDLALPATWEAAYERDVIQLVRETLGV